MSSRSDAVAAVTGLAAFVDRPGVYSGRLVDAADVLDPVAFDYFSQPRTVADTLLEIELFGTGPEAVRLLESLQGRDLTTSEAVQVAGLWVALYDAPTSSPAPMLVGRRHARDTPMVAPG